MIKILFICHGNICRSPMAEFVMKEIVKREGVGERFHIESAATSSEEIYNGRGNPVYPPARKKLAEHGLSCECKRARLMTREDYNNFDYIIGMDEANIRNILRIAGIKESDKVTMLLDYAGEHRSISDPWYTGDFELTWQDVKKGCEAFYKSIKESIL